jgi:hypothetical protein
MTNRRMAACARSSRWSTRRRCSILLKVSASADLQSPNARYAMMAVHFVVLSPLVLSCTSACSVVSCLHRPSHPLSSCLAIYPSRHVFDLVPLLSLPSPSSCSHTSCLPLAPLAHQSAGCLSEYIVGTASGQATEGAWRAGAAA